MKTMAKSKQSRRIECIFHLKTKQSFENGFWCVPMCVCPSDYNIFSFFIYDGRLTKPIKELNDISKSNESRKINA